VTIVSLGRAPHRAIVVREQRGGNWTLDIYGAGASSPILRRYLRNWATEHSARAEAWMLHAATGIPVCIQRLGDGVRPLREKTYAAVSR
jgi:hypothetical protein